VGGSEQVRGDLERTDHDRTTTETFCEEKRPFFLEGKRIFTLGSVGSAIAGDESGTDNEDANVWFNGAETRVPVAPASAARPAQAGRC